MFISEHWEYDEGPYDYAEATAACNARGMAVVFIESADENTQVGTLLPQEDKSWAWIGNPSLAANNKYSNFLPGRGNNPYNKCTRFFSFVWGSHHDQWDDQPCRSQGPVVCEKLVQTETTQGIRYIHLSH